MYSPSLAENGHSVMFAQDGLNIELATISPGVKFALNDEGALVCYTHIAALNQFTEDYGNPEEGISNPEEDISYAVNDPLRAAFPDSVQVCQSRTERCVKDNEGYFINKNFWEMWGFRFQEHFNNDGSLRDPDQVLHRVGTGNTAARPETLSL